MATLHDPYPTPTSQCYRTCEVGDYNYLKTDIQCLERAWRSIICDLVKTSSVAIVLQSLNRS